MSKDLENTMILMIDEIKTYMEKLLQDRNNCRISVMGKNI
jgi:hypothetical protein